MAENSNIEWCDHTWSPWEGCQKAGPGCDHCYAEARNKRFSRGANWGPGAPRRKTADWSKPDTWNRKAAAASRRERVFPSLCDPFDNAVPAKWRAELWLKIHTTPHLDWLLLTKRIGNAERMVAEVLDLLARFGITKVPAWPANVWLGATVVNQAEADRDVPKLLAVPARMRFLSVEPMLGPIDLTRMDVMQGDAEIYPLNGTTDCVNSEGEPVDDIPAIDWVICGGESGPGVRPMHPDWARGLRDQCAAAGTPFLFKQWGTWLPTSAADWCRSPTAPENAAFREKYGRGGYEFPGKESRAILRDGRTARVDPAGGDLWHRPMGMVVDQTAMAAFAEYLRTGKDDPGLQWVHAVGKKEAGRLLDGVEHNGFPEATCAT